MQLDTLNHSIKTSYSRIDDLHDTVQFFYDGDDLYQVKSRPLRVVLHKDFLNVKASSTPVVLYTNDEFFEAGTFDKFSVTFVKDRGVCITGGTDDCGLE